MKKIFIAAALLSAIATGAQAQKVVDLKPTVYPLKAWTEKDLQKWEQKMKSYDTLIEKYHTAGEESLSESEREKLNEFWMLNENEDTRPGWDVDEYGCSWYCGAQYDTRVSSSLKSTQNNDYGVERLEDRDLRNAWIEGVPGYGIGEYIEFTFPVDAPRATTCLIYNGYMKSPGVWKNNSRVKTMNLYDNDVLIAVLHLEDSFATMQSFELPYPAGRRADGQDTHLKFLITEVYKGDKYDDTAISEFLFDGMDVHCLAEGTKVQTTSGLKNIEDISIGDEVVTFNSADRSLGSSSVSAVHSAEHSDMLRLTFEGGAVIVTTLDHPFFTDKGWASSDPAKTAKYGRFSSVAKYAEGDKFATYSLGKIVFQTLKSIEAVVTECKSYTLETDDGDGFIAGGLIVGEE